VGGSIDKAGLQVDAALVRFIEDEALPGTGIDPARFWTGMADLFRRFAPENRALLARRDELRPRSTPGMSRGAAARSTRPSIAGSWRRSAIWSPSRSRSRSRRPMSTMPSRGSRGRSWWCRC
jgi:hypothetical protein